MNREQALDSAVRQAADAWAIMTPRDMLLRRWLSNLAGDDLDGVEKVIVPVIKANFSQCEARS
jgi:hypothetical protein